MKDKLAKLIDVKSLVTLALVLVLCVMTVLGKPMPDQFNNAIMLVLGFFFGKNLGKEPSENKEKEPSE